MPHEATVVPCHYVSSPLLELQKSAHITTRAVEVASAMRKQLGERHGNIAWRVLFYGLTRLILDFRWIDSWILFLCLLVTLTALDRSRIDTTVRDWS